MFAQKLLKDVTALCFSFFSRTLKCRVLPSLADFQELSSKTTPFLVFDQETGANQKAVSPVFLFILEK